MQKWALLRCAKGPLSLLCKSEDKCLESSVLLSPLSPLRLLSSPSPLSLLSVSSPLSWQWHLTDPVQQHKPLQ